MGYLIEPPKQQYLLFNFTNSELSSWGGSTLLLLKNTQGFIVDQCSILYTNATSVLQLAGAYEINLIDIYGTGIQFAFNSGLVGMKPYESFRLSGGNKSSNAVLPYDTSNDYSLELTTSVISGDGELQVFLWGTYR